MQKFKIQCLKKNLAYTKEVRIKEIYTQTTLHTPKLLPCHGWTTQWGGNYPHWEAPGAQGGG